MPICPKCNGKLIKRISNMSFNCRRHGLVRYINSPQPSKIHEARMTADYSMMDDTESFVPHHMRDGFKMWIEHGILPGSFGTAVLKNDLKEAVGRADHINQNHIKSIVCWLYNFAPSNCWGSPEDVRKWAETTKKKPLGEQND